MFARMRGRFAGLTVGAVMALALVTTASAEGYFTSYMQGVYPGFRSRSWDDNNTDAVSTKVLFRDCIYGSWQVNPVDTDIRLRKHIAWQPDQTIGEDNLSCYVSDSASFGDLAAGKYHFDIKKVMGTEFPSIPLDVDYVRVDW